MPRLSREPALQCLQHLREFGETCAPLPSTAYDSATLRHLEQQLIAACPQAQLRHVEQDRYAAETRAR
jgi:hypothetical protein